MRDAHLRVTFRRRHPGRSAPRCRAMLLLQGGSAMASAPLGLAEIEAMIADAEARIVALRRYPARDGGPVRDPADPLDKLSCLEIWLRALCRTRMQMLLGMPETELPAARPSWLH